MLALVEEVAVAGQQDAPLSQRVGEVVPVVAALEPDLLGGDDVELVRPKLLDGPSGEVGVGVEPRLDLLLEVGVEFPLLAFGEWLAWEFSSVDPRHERTPDFGRRVLNCRAPRLVIEAESHLYRNRDVLPRIILRVSSKTVESGLRVPPV